MLAIDLFVQLRLYFSIVMETTKQPLKVDVYFDYSCPWCYIGFKRYQEVGVKFVVHVQAIARYGKTVELIQHPVSSTE